MRPSLYQQAGIVLIRSRSQLSTSPEIAITIAGQAAVERTGHDLQKSILSPERTSVASGKIIESAKSGRSERARTVISYSMPKRSESTLIAVLL